MFNKRVLLVVKEKLNSVAFATMFALDCNKRESSQNSTAFWFRTMPADPLNLSVDIK